MSQAADLYCVMGNPVAHSRSPAIHARFAELTGEHIAYERRLVPMDGFAQGVRDFMAEKNAPAQKELADRLIEAIERGLWTPKSNSAKFTLVEMVEGEQHA